MPLILHQHLQWKRLNKQAQKARALYIKTVWTPKKLLMNNERGRPGNKANVTADTAADTAAAAAAAETAEIALTQQHRQQQKQLLLLDL